MKKAFFLFSILGISFLSGQVGTTCANPIVIGSLPYTTTDDTANYADNYDPDESNNPPCSGSADDFGNFYHGGNDVIYSYTPTTTGTIKIEIPASAAIGWTGMFVYNSCTDIGLNYAACEGNVSDGDALTIDNFVVTAGQTYYILISSWPDPQTVSYTLNVTSLNLAVQDTELAKKQTSVYPNPAGKDLSFKSPKDIVFANVYTMEGKKIKSYKVHGNTISVDDLSAGSYIVEFTDKSDTVSTKVFIKK
ncbi:T9SS type A sorting domain-containing protein [Chryseobacterium sp. T16E-39]|uniref:T9SS type A sorting domain-containing protein n=1 Tax=Chryseobacterium sp. T16E-39 TaxID=2015076 RepID=UPI0012F762E6|nr:T9SS type A sorting domain-containing protein [Chryseobacterium sp. T16E-39]